MVLVRVGLTELGVGGVVVMVVGAMGLLRALVKWGWWCGVVIKLVIVVVTGGSGEEKFGEIC